MTVLGEKIILCHLNQTSSLPNQKMADEDITEFVKNQLILPVKIDPADELSWQHHLYSTLGNKKPSQVSDMKKEALDLLVQRIVALGKVLFGLHMVIMAGR